jgi:hypothetical protein
VIRLEIEEEYFDDFVNTLDGFTAMLRVVQQQQGVVQSAEPAADNTAEREKAFSAGGAKDGEVIPPEPEKKPRGRSKKEPAQIDIEEKIAEKAPEIGDVRAALVDLIKHTDEATALKLAKDIGGTVKLKDVPAEKYAAIIKAAQIEIDRVKATA